VLDAEDTVATIYDVARAAGVTAATVSVALSGRGVVNRQTRERIIRCAEELGYRPNLVARSLTMGRTRTIGLVVNDITNPFYAEVALAVEQTAQRSGYRVIFANTTGDPALGVGLLEELAARQVDGIIVMAGGVSAAAVRSIAATGIPIVPCMWDEEEDHGLPTSVGVDFCHAGRLAADHLLDLGHRRIGIVAASAYDSARIRIREAVCRDRLAERGAPMDPALWYGAQDSLETGYAAGRYLLTLAEPPSAVFASNDLMAIGVLTAARELGVCVPDQLSVIGFDDIAMSRYVSPSLTTLHIEKPELMARAVEVLLTLISGDTHPSAISIVPSLTIRESTAPPGRAPKGKRGKEVHSQ
jgi:DNA-binding LacI/PurR family transcriptional regulator